MSVLVDRRGILFLAASLATSLSTACLGAVHCRHRRVLFVCQFGTVKSPVAREFFRRRAAERGFRVEAEARGITPAGHRSDDLRRGLKLDHINVGADPLRKLAAADARRADVLVFFDKLPPQIRAAITRDWTELPSMNSNYQAARSELLRRIDLLLDDPSVNTGKGDNC